MSNKLVIAAAGSGKTAFLVEEALRLTNAKVLITTYTEANEAEIRKKITDKYKYIPNHIYIQTWVSFLLQHGVRPYQDYLYNQDINGMNLVGGQSARLIKESNIVNHYFDKQQRIYSDKISKFIIACNEASRGKVIDRLSKIYSHIFIDEVQDLAGYDLELLKLFFTSSIQMLLVGDPRQGTYSTSNSAKNKKYQKSNIYKFFEGCSINIDKDETSLTVNYRSIPAITDYSNKLYPLLIGTTSGNKSTSVHDGIYLVRPSDVEIYLEQYFPMQLRDSQKKIVDNIYKVMNFGQSKGLTFDRVLIYPTKPIMEWIKNNSYELTETTRSRLYVAITRAKFSVAFVYDFKDGEDIPSISNYSVTTIP